MSLILQQLTPEASLPKNPWTFSKIEKHEFYFIGGYFWGVRNFSGRKFDVSCFIR